jgi:hypothetical protein
MAGSAEGSRSAIQRPTSWSISGARARRRTGASTRLGFGGRASAAPTRQDELSSRLSATVRSVRQLVVPRASLREEIIAAVVLAYKPRNEVVTVLIGAPARKVHPFRVRRLVDVV